MTRPRAIETHDELVTALRELDGLEDVGNSRPNFHFRSRPFLHFHTGAQGIYADVKLGTPDFREIPVSTPEEREELLIRVKRHITRIDRTRKTRR
ncbi:MAG TPA: hypothetical protein VL856_05630 [Acidimicrobiia bacterium]|nr:hypothetical protein [Acidimicrobiia bacterium]